MYKIILLGLLLSACSKPPSERTGVTEKEFVTLMKNIAQGWSTQNTDLALSSFQEDAHLHGAT